MKKVLIALFIIMTSGCSYVAPAFQCATVAIGNPKYAPSACRSFFNDVEDEEKAWCDSQDVWPERCLKYAKNLDHYYESKPADFE